jgi:CHAT domain-containing protein
VLAHGRVDPERPAHGHLLLGAEASGAIRRLEAWQARELRLGGATVVLSACDSGRTAWRAGAGLAGLLRGFLEGGAGEVVASPWVVDGHATARFMEHFHGARAAGADTPEALRRARIALRQELDARGFALSHPLFWAGWFVQR